MQAILLDRTKNLVAFFDDSRDLKNRLINNIPIYGSIEKLKSLRDNNNDLEVLLAIPSLESEKRRDVIAKLEKLKISVSKPNKIMYWLKLTKQYNNYFIF